MSILGDFALSKRNAQVENSDRFPKRIPGEKVYSDFNEETGNHEVIGEDSGHSYASYSSKEEAKAAADKRNYRAAQSTASLDRTVGNHLPDLEKVGQSEVDGSPTKKVDNDMEEVVEADRDPIAGSSYSPLYWAMEISKTILAYNGANPDLAMKSVLEHAKQTGLSKEQEREVKNLLIKLHVPVDAGKLTDDKPIETNNLNFPQKQVAAALQAKAHAKRQAQALLDIAQLYYANKPKLVAKYNGIKIDRRIASLLKSGFSREEVAKDLASWKFAESTKRVALSKLLPKKIALSSGSDKKVLANSRAKSKNQRHAQAVAKIAESSKTEGLTKEQLLRMAGLKSLYVLDTPFWIVRGQRDLGDIRKRLERDHEFVGEDENSGALNFKHPSKPYTVKVTPTTTSFTSTIDPEHYYAFGTDPKKIDNLAHSNVPWPTQKQAPVESDEPQDTPAPAKEAKPVVEKGPSARGIMLPMIAQGKSDDEIHEHLSNHEAFQHRDPKGLRAQIGLNRKWLEHPDRKDKLEMLKNKKQASIEYPITVFARLKDARILTATIQPNGSSVHRASLNYDCKKALRSADSKEEGWIQFVQTI